MVKCLFQTDLPAPAVLSTRRVRWGARQRLIKGAESVRGTLSHAREISSSSKLHLTQKGTCTSRGQKNRSVDYHPRHAPGFQKAPSSLALLSNFFWKCRFAFSKGNGRAAGVYTGQIVFFAIGGERQFFCRRCGPRLLIFPSLRLPRSDTTPASPPPPLPLPTPPGGHDGGNYDAAADEIPARRRLPPLAWQPRVRQPVRQQLHRCRSACGADARAQ